MKNTNKGYKVDFINGTIIITKAFAAKAGTYGTTEFKELNEVRNAYPDFKIEYKVIKKKKDKVSYDGLSIEKMIAFIQMKDSEVAAVEFKKYVDLYEGEKGKYPIIKRMFLAKYKEVYNNLSTDEKIALDILDKKTRKEISENEELAA